MSRFINQGEWFEDHATAELVYIQPGKYESEPGQTLPAEAFGPRISRVNGELNQLIVFLLHNGYIKPQLGENRTEDTKIIHRLIDTVQQALPKEAKPLLQPRPVRHAAEEVSL